MSDLPDSITCPQCGKTSHNPNDVRERYCGFCHQFHEFMKIGGAMSASTIGFEVEDGFTLEDHGWIETSNNGTVKNTVVGSSVSSITETFTRGADEAIVVNWGSPTRITSWSKNGRAGGDKAAFMRAVERKKNG